MAVVHVRIPVVFSSIMVFSFSSIMVFSFSSIMVFNFSTFAGQQVGIVAGHSHSLICIYTDVAGLAPQNFATLIC